ncbi:conjugal transfer protein TraB [Rahnella bruchi]|uniref:conjugal transfer protein TraB n=1 Tax=Rahnella bruchi TaxID=1510573 RepID=UPI001FCA19D4|nr:conjugal transfer protein TraB [Rahnella bruchi]
MNINSLVKRKQLLWLSLVAATVGTAIAAGWYLSDIDRPVSRSSAQLAVGIAPGSS